MAFSFAEKSTPILFNLAIVYSLSLNCGQGRSSAYVRCQSAAVMIRVRTISIRGRLPLPILDPLKRRIEPLGRVGAEVVPHAVLAVTPGVLQVPFDDLLI